MFCDLRTKTCDHRRGDCLIKQCFWVKGTPKKKAERVKRNLAPGCKKMEFGYKYEGEALAKIDRVASGIKCNAHCFENAKCKAWTWGKTKGHPNANICFLLKNMKSKKKNPDYDSGLPDRGGGKDKDDKKMVVKASKVAFIDGYARFRKAQRLERMQVIRQIKRMHQLVRNREMQKLRARQTLDRLKQLRKLQMKQRKERKIYRLRMSGKMPMPGGKKRKFKLGGEKSGMKMKIPKKLSEMKIKLKELKNQKKQVKKERKKLNKLEKKTKNGPSRNLYKEIFDERGLALNSLEKGAVKSDSNSDFEQFKKELFDDYDDSGRIAKSGSKKIKKEMKKAFRKLRVPKLQEVDMASTAKRELRREMRKLFKKSLKNNLGSYSDGSRSDFSSSLYGGIWGGDDHSRSRESSRSRSPRRSRRSGSRSSVAIGFDYSRRKI